MANEFEVRITRNDLPKKKRELPGEMKKRMDALAEEGTNIAKVSMQQSPASGRSYMRGKKMHTASSPGNPPRPDSGRLVNSMRWDRMGTNGQTQQRRIIAATEYAFYEEFGTTKMEARPFMGPMAQQLRGLVKGHFDGILEED